MKKAVFFDLYGTLINIVTDEHDPWVYEMFSRYLAYHSVYITADRLKMAYIRGVQQYLHQSKELYPEVDVYKVFYDIMHKHGNRKRYAKGTIIDVAVLFRLLTLRQFGVFEGLPKVLPSIGRKYRIAVISDAQWIFAEPEMAMLGLERFFKVRILSSRIGFKKPDTRLFRLAMERLGVSPEESVYIGDNPSKDIVGAKNAGMRFILFGSECRHYNGFQPDGCFNDYSKLEDTLKEVIL